MLAHPNPPLLKSILQQHLDGIKELKMAKTTTEIQRESDDKRGVKTQSYKLKVSTINLIEQLSEQLNLPKKELIDIAVKHYAESLSK